MALIAQEQIRRLGTHALTRDGIDLMGVANLLACWNFALSGTFLGMAHPQSPDSIYSGSGEGQDPDAALLNIAIWPAACTGLKDTADIDHHPGCQAELDVLHNRIDEAVDGDVPAQSACAEAMVKIVARKNGLVPGVADDRYRLHMKANAWFGWDHWALSIKPLQPGRPRIFIQTVTGVPLAHACTTIWDEHLPVSVAVNIRELHQDQVNFINAVNTFGDLCIQCGAAHGRFPSNPFNAWHRCTTCHAVYCPTHGQALGGKLNFSDRTRTCGRIGCVGRTEILSFV